MDTDQLEWIWKRMEIGGPLPGWQAASEGHLHFLERLDDAARWWRIAPDGPWMPALEDVVPAARAGKPNHKPAKGAPRRTRRGRSAAPSQKRAQ